MRKSGRRDLAVRPYTATHVFAECLDDIRNHGAQSRAPTMFAIRTGRTVSPEEVSDDH